MKAADAKFARSYLAHKAILDRRLNSWPRGEPSSEERQAERAVTAAKDEREEADRLALRALQKRQMVQRDRETRVNAWIAKHGR